MNVGSVDLHVFDWMENVVLELGWIVADAIWHALNISLIAALPFIVLVIREWYTARREGEDEGNKGLLALNRIEASLFAMFFVYLFAAVPLLNVTFAPVNIDQQHLQQCSIRVAGAVNTGNGGAQLGGHSAEIPVWWAAVHAVSHGVTNMAIAALPCQTNYEYIRTQLDASSIHDPELRREVNRFQRWCYGPAHRKFFREHNQVGAARARDTDWIGSKYLLTTAGYYDSFHSHQPVKSFAYQASRDKGRGTKPSAGGYPTCNQWWTAANHGLRDRLHNQIDPTFWQNVQGAFSWSSTDEDYAIRALVKKQAAVGNASADAVGQHGGDSGHNIAGTTVGFAGVALAGLPAEGMKDVGMRALPMVQYLTMMALVIITPIIIVLSGYSFRVAGLLTAAYFGLTMLTFWFELARWLQNHLIGLLYYSHAAQMGFFAGLTNAYDEGVLGLVQVGMMMVFPALWLSVLGWAGWTAGAGLSSTIKAGSEDAKGAGQKGGQATNSLATKGARGLKS